jgi:hypothetical protein
MRFNNRVADFTLNLQLTFMPRALNSTSENRRPPTAQNQVSAEVGDDLFEIKTGIDSHRTLSTALVKLAYLLGERPKSRGFLVMVDSAISQPRLLHEWLRASKTFRPDILNRLTWCVVQNGIVHGVPEKPSSEVQRAVLELVSKERASTAPRATRSRDPLSDILRILINQWLNRAGPLTSRWIAEAAGCTYPTVASALEKLEKYLVRHSDRRVELKTFPRDEWSRLVANAEKVRQTLRFADRSGQPRSIESLHSRFDRIRTETMAIGGVLGARRRQPQFDLLGTPRLDLSIHCRTPSLDLAFLRQLDPALEPAHPEESARLVIHMVRYPHSFFETASDGSSWADPVECLLDLHEMRLESQAKDFLQFLTPSAI